MLICEIVKSLVIYLWFSVLYLLWQKCEMLKSTDTICDMIETTYLCT